MTKYPTTKTSRRHERESRPLTGGLRVVCAVTIVALTACLLVPAASIAQDATPTRPKLLSEYTDIPGLTKSLAFSTPGAMDLLLIIETFSEGLSKLNVVVSANVAGTVRFKLGSATVGEILEIALAANNVAYEVTGTGEKSIINIMTGAEYLARHGVDFYEHRMTKIVDLKHTKPSHINAVLKDIMSAGSKIIVDDPSGTLILIDTAKKIAEMDVIIAQMDAPVITRSFRLQYADPSDIATAITDMSLLTEGRNAVVDIRSKTVLITDLKYAVDNVARLIETFDRKPNQVSIQAKVIQVTLNDKHRMGVNWHHVMNSISPRASLGIGTILPVPERNTQINYKTILGGADLDIAIEALQTAGETRIISNPNISALDGQEATIKVIRKVPWREVRYEPGTTNVVGEFYQFEEIGAILSVTPRINDDGFVRVDIKPTISSMGEHEAGVSQPPIIKKSEAMTTVMVKDGITIIIGGMIETMTEDVNTSVPIIGRIPLFGHFFRSSATQKVKTETIVFLTPHIITGEEHFLQLQGPANKDPKFRLKRHQKKDIEDSSKPQPKTRRF
jgi:type II secretory pathway component GspD/PulD (secretin)